MMKLMKEEVLHEMDAVKNFIGLAIVAQKEGYPKAAEFFLKAAQEDCYHAFRYGIELDKHDAIDDKRNLIDTLENFFEMEHGAVNRIHSIMKEAKDESIFESKPFLIEMMADHSKDAYTAKKLLQQVKILENSIVDIESLFDELTEK